MTALETLLSAIVGDPRDDSAWLALADCLEEQGRQDEAELTRLRECLRQMPPDDPQRERREPRLRELLEAGVRPIVPRRVLQLDENIKMAFVLVPPGHFWMGSPHTEIGRYSDEGPVHRVTLTHGFWFGETLVTQAQWESVARRNPSRFVALDQPVECVSWHDCRSFCRLLGERHGGIFRLPSEAEWEYACRAGTTTRFHGGASDPDLARVGWYHNNTEYGTKPVGLKEPNAWGLLDIHGNVREWCLDVERDYSGIDLVDPVVEADSGNRILRGGSWYNSPEMCRSAFRFAVEPSSSSYGYGCRVVLETG
jgi:uncharacterized protein (TIGR02996 family)